MYSRNSSYIIRLLNCAVLSQNSLVRNSSIFVLKFHIQAATPSDICNWNLTRLEVTEADDGGQNSKR